MKPLFTGLGVVAIVALVIGAILTVPFLFIWSLNTLFLLNIGYSLNTWAAALIFCMFFAACSK